MKPRIDKELSTHRRVYVQSARGHPVNGKLREIGMHWDPDLLRWWCARTEGKLAEINAALLTHGGELRFARVEGDTYPARDQLDRLGGRLESEFVDGRKKWFWLVPEGLIEEANRAVKQVEAWRGRRKSRGQCTECGQWGPAGEACVGCGGEGTHA